MVPCRRAVRRTCPTARPVRSGGVAGPRCAAVISPRRDRVRREVQRAEGRWGRCSTGSQDVLIGPLLRLLFRPQVEGLENLPETGPAILAGNHLSFLDSIFLPLVCKRRITFLAKSDYFTGRGIKGRLIRGSSPGSGRCPIDRSGGSASEAALATGLRVLEAGTCSASTPRAPAPATAGSTAARPGWPGWRSRPASPSVPCAMVGTDLVQPPGKAVPAHHAGQDRDRGAAGLLPLRRHEGDRFVLRSMTDEIMYELMSLSGQEYVDIYAASAKGGPEPAASELPGTGQGSDEDPVAGVLA